MPAPDLFDRRLLTLKRARAARMGWRDDVLLPRIAEDMADRLAAVLRDFSSAVDIGTPGPDVARAVAASPRVRSVRHLAARSPDDAAVAVIDEELLPLGEASIDLAVSGMALHWINDLPGTLLQVRRALKPDGLFLAAFPGGDTLTELRQALALAESRVTGGISPRVSPFADVRDMGALLQRAGFALPVSDIDRLTLRYGSLAGLFRDLRTLGATNILTERNRRPMSRTMLAQLIEIYQEKFSDPDGRLRVTVDILWLSGWAPHDSQQKPLKPGSAKMRLADALGTVEKRIEG